MNNEVKIFLQSGLLEEYILGLCEDSEISLVESYISKYPEVKAEYNRLQDNLAQYASKIAIVPPSGTKEAILEEVDAAERNTKGSASPFRIGRMMSIAAVILGLLSFWFWNQWSAATQSNQELSAQLQNLQQDCEAERKQRIALDQRLQILGSPNTSKYVLAGLANTNEFKAVAYWNKAEASSYIEVISHPVLKEKECLQLWADVKGEMLSLGVLPNKDRNFFKLPFLANAESLNITIEPEGGSEHPNVSRLVTSVSI